MSNIKKYTTYNHCKKKAHTCTQAFSNKTVLFFITTLKIKTGDSNECCIFDILKKKNANCVILDGGFVVYVVRMVAVHHLNV